MNIQEEARRYAQDRILSLLEQAVADAYVKGYNAACDEMNNQKGKIVEVDGLTFVDMDLPSGTLWCTDLYGGLYSLKKGHLMNYQEALKYSLPTWEQCEELFKHCKVTRSGNSGYIEILSKSSEKIYLPSILEAYSRDCQDNVVSFWLIDNSDKSINAYCAETDNLERKKEGAIVRVSRNRKFKGDKLPILLVKSK